MQYFFLNLEINTLDFLSFVEKNIQNRLNLGDMVNRTGDREICSVSGNVIGKGLFCCLLYKAGFISSYFSIYLTWATTNWFMLTL